ncbi:S41 family peptidase [Sphingomicrobium astaxanthinifaciens]|uniref:S41 family peptidase n=1 Tax=Sphingomicrobium astaxanthinifaciens TaxID=1227949 RepID=UPI001FCADF8F|nr:S41 family peptidase [Sphingomicrobium astaxanthinifaciens]MCJ7422341.1 S41 family peptidase [Sphingomicrobium astaxanthinifaciens]
MRIIPFAAALLAATASPPLAAATTSATTSATTIATPATTPCTPATCYAAGALRKDLLRLHRKLPKLVHNLYAHVDADAMDAAYREALASMVTDLPKPQAHLLFQRYLTTARIGHLETDAVVADVIAHFRSGGRLVPFNVRVVRNGLETSRFAVGDDRLPDGSIITSINGEPSHDVIERVDRIIAADSWAMVEAIAEQGFPIYYYLLEGEVDSVDLDVILPDGSATSFTLDAGATLRRMEQHAPGEAAAREEGEADFSTREIAFPGDGIAYLRPGPFHNLEGEAKAEGVQYDPAAFEAFLTDAFDRIAAADASDLLIDLRDNPGGDNSFSDLLVARVADKPFSWASRFEVRASAAGKERVADTTPEPGTLEAQMKALEDQTANGAIYTVRLPKVAPRPDNRFDGRVWSLVDRHSYSNAVVVAATLKDHGFATILGEDTRDVATTYGSAEQWTLPETGIVVTYPKSYIVRPGGTAFEDHVEPDVTLDEAANARSERAMLDAALAHIRAQR